MRYEEIGKKIKEIRKSKLELELDFKEVGALPVLKDILKEFN